MTLAQPITVIASLAGLIIVVAGLQLAVLGSRLDTHAERLGGRIDSLAERLGGRIDTLGAQVAAADTRLQDVAHDVRKIRDDVYEPVRRAPQQ